MPASIMDQYLKSAANLQGYRRTTDGSRQITTLSMKRHLREEREAARKSGMEYLPPRKPNTPEEQVAAGLGNPAALQDYIREYDLKRKEIRDRFEDRERQRAGLPPKGAVVWDLREKTEEDVRREHLAYVERCEARRKWKERIQVAYRDYMSRGSVMDAGRRGARWPYDMTWIDAMDPNDDKYPRNVEIIGDKRVDEWVRWSVNHRIGSDGKIYAKGEFGYDFA